MTVFGNYSYIVYIASAAFVILAVFLMYVYWRRRVLRSMPARGLLVAGPSWRRKLKTALIAVSVILFALTVLRPQWGERMREVSVEGTDVLIALDISRSMLSEDVEPSRLERAKEAVRWIAGSLKGGRIGLIVFAGDAFMLCPMTTDIGAFLMFLDSAGPQSVALQGTDFSRMFQEAYRVFETKRLTTKMLVLITDGEDNEGSARDAAEKFRELGVAVYSCGIGRDDGGFIPAGEDQGGEVYRRDGSGSLIRTELNEGLLKQLSGLTRGSYINISDSLSGLRFILSVIENQESSEFGSRMVREPIDRFVPFAVALLVLLSAELMLTERPGLYSMKLNIKKAFTSKKKSGGDADAS